MRRKPSPAPQRPTGRSAKSVSRTPGAAEPETTPPSDHLTPTNPEDVWSSLRQGARNVAGVRWQVAVIAHLLVLGHAGQLPFRHFTPEGLEDVDCRDIEGNETLVQMKEVGAGAGRLTAVDVADALEHADTHAGKRWIVLATDGELGSGLKFTGWTESLGEQAGKPTDDVVTHLVKRGISKEDARALLTRTRVLWLPWNLRPWTEQAAADSLKVHPTVAGFAVGSLYDLVGSYSADQRMTTRATAKTCTVGDLDSIAAEVQTAVNVDDLDAALSAGVCVPANYALGTDLSAGQFYGGVDGAPGHISAHLDVVRPAEMLQVLRAFETDRYALLLGPSGSGKSVLLWRAARDTLRGARVVRVTRLVETGDVDLLERHIRLQRPAPSAPVVVAADNLGRPMMALWPLAVERLREIPGVLVLGAVRAEDFSPRLVRGGASVIELRMDLDTAQRIADRVREAGIPAHMAPAEARERADGLLMEYLALLTTGRRLESVLAEQVEELKEPGRELSRTLVRLVTAAHAAGLSIPADVLPLSVNAAPEVVGDALATLRGEHLLVEDRTTWRGLHELRSHTITRLMHESPPPTLASTYARIAALLPASAAGWLLRRAVQELSEQAMPVAEATADRVRSLERAQDLSLLMEGAERADTLLHTQHALPVLQSHRRGNTTLSQLALRVNMVSNGWGQEPTSVPAFNQAVARMREIAAEIGPRPALVASLVASRVTPDHVQRLCMESPLADAVRLLESLLGSADLAGEVAAAILRGFDVPENPGQADLHARLISALAALTGMTGDDLASAFGNTTERADAVMRADPYALAVSVVTTEEGVAVTARIMHPPHPALPDDSVAWDSEYRPSSDPATGIAVRVATRLADACPEAAIVEVITETPSGSRLKVADLEPGYKRMPRSSFPPREMVRRSVGFQAAIRRLTAASSWTELIREQTAISAELNDLLTEAPARLSPASKRELRTDWLARAQTVAQRTSLLAARPVSTAVDLDLSHARADDTERQTDLASDALSDVAQVLPDLLDPSRPLVLAGKLDSAAAKVRQARSVSDPFLAGIGKPLPEQLDSLLATLIDILRAAASDPALPRRISPKKATNARALVERVGQEVAERERTLLEDALVDVAGVTLARVADSNPPSNTIDRGAWVVLTPVESWNQTIERLRTLTPEQRMALTSKVVAVAAVGDQALPLAITVTTFGDRLELPINADTYKPLIDQLGVRAGEHPWTTLLNTVLNELVGLSFSTSLARARNQSWPCLPDQQGAPTVEALRTKITAPGNLPQGVVQNAMLWLIEHVENEQEAGTPSVTLAGAIFDSQGLGSPPDPKVSTLWENIQIVSAMPYLLLNEEGAQGI